MGRSDETLIDPPTDELLRALVKATEASGRGRWGPGRVTRTEADWLRFVSSLSAREGIERLVGPDVDHRPGGWVALAWWTDGVGRRHARVTGEDWMMRSTRDDNAAADDSPVEALTWIYPERLYHHETNGLIAVCDCGVAGSPADLCWTGTCCGPCHDHHADHGWPDPNGAVTRDVLRLNAECDVLSMTPDANLILVRYQHYFQCWSPPQSSLRTIPWGNLPMSTLTDRCGAIAPDGRRMALSVDQELRILDTRTDEVFFSMRTPANIAEMATMPDGRFVVAMRDGTVFLNHFDHPDHTLRHITFTGLIASQIQVSRSGQVVLVGREIIDNDNWSFLSAANSMFVLWSPPSQVITRTLTGPTGMRASFRSSISQSSDGSLLALITSSRSDVQFDQISLLDSRSGQVLNRIDSQVGAMINSVAITPDGSALVTAGGSRLCWMSMTDREQTKRWSVFPKSIRDLRFSTDGSTLVMTGEDGSIRRCAWNSLMHV